jgi:DNA-binding MarR family transcriptional regulator
MLLALQRATHSTLEIIGHELSDLSLSSSEINAMANLADGNARTVRQLAASIGTRPSTMTGVLDRLEQGGLVVRTSRGDDRRIVSISLTSSGERVAAHIRQVFSDLEHRALRGLEAETISALKLGLAALAELTHE